MQIDYAPITPAPTTAGPILEPPPRSPSSTTRRPLPCYQRRHINNDDLIKSIDRVGLKLADCLSITESALDTFVQHRPPSNPDLSEAARETTRVTALPFGFTNVTAAYQHALSGKLADQVDSTRLLTDQVAIQLPPAINTLHLGRSPGALLQTILKETPGSES